MNSKQTSSSPKAAFSIKNIRSFAEKNEPQHSSFFAKEKPKFMNVLLFPELYSSLLSMYNKRKYRKLLTQLTKNEHLYDKMNLANNLALTHLKFKCMFMIISKKVFKYQKRSAIKNLDNWLSFTEKQLDLFANEIKLLPKTKQINQYELYSLYQLNYIYYSAYYYKHASRINDCISMLCLAEKLINALSVLFINGEVLHIVIKLYLFISSMLISDKCFVSAKTYLIKAMLLCHKEICINMETEHTIAVDGGYDYISSNSFKVGNNEEMFLHMGLIFYQLGVCSESSGDICTASLCYCNAMHVFNSYVIDTHPHLCEIMCCIYERCQRHISFFNVFIRNELQNGDFFDSKQKPRKQQLYFDNEQRIQKYDNVKKIIASLDLHDVDEDEHDIFDKVGQKPKPYKIKQMTKHVHLYDYLMTNEFKPVIKQMRSLEINKLNHETKRKIQKKIIKIKANQRVYTQETPSNTNNRYLHTSTSKKRNARTKTHSHSNTLSSTISTFSRRSMKPEKIKYDKYIFDKDFRRRITFIDGLSNREYNFQKQILKCKKQETLPTEPYAYDEDKTQRHAELFYKYELAEIMKLIQEKEKTVKVNNDKHDIQMQKVLERLKAEFQNRLCKSLNIKVKDKYEEEYKKIINANVIKRFALLSASPLAEMNINTSNNTNNNNTSSSNNGNGPSIVRRSTFMDEYLKQRQLPKYDEEDLEENTKKIITKLEYDIDELDKKNERLNRRYSIVSKNK